MHTLMQAEDLVKSQKDFGAMEAPGALVMTKENPYHQLRGCMEEYKERFDSLSERGGVVPLVAYQVLTWSIYNAHLPYMVIFTVVPLVAYQVLTWSIYNAHLPYKVIFTVVPLVAYQVLTWSIYITHTFHIW